MTYPTARSAARGICGLLAKAFVGQAICSRAQVVLKCMVTRAPNRGGWGAWVSLGQFGRSVKPPVHLCLAWLAV